MRRLHAAVIAMSATFAASTLHAQWVSLPHGEAGYIVNYSTSGTFRCLAAERYDTGSCQASGNEVTLFDGAGGSATFTFTGTRGSTVAANYAQSIQMGAFTSSVTGDFAFPLLGGDSWSYFVFAGALQLDPDRPQIYSWGGGYFLRGDALRDSQHNFGFGPQIAFRLPPGGGAYGMLVVSGLDLPSLRPGMRPYTLVGHHAIVPEPTTVALLGGGLLALGAVGAVRRRRKP